MAETRPHPILTYLRRILGDAPNSVADAELLRRFVADRDEAAFELLLWRHAAMVWRVCGQIAPDPHSAEDAFQATFLVLLRKADSICRRDSLAAWLYRVAYRIALKARQRCKKQVAASHDPDLLAASEYSDAEMDDVRRAICEEVHRLPAKYRAVVTACYFESRTHEEAAKQLGLPQGTVASRVARARELLRCRLVRRGLTLTAAILTTALAVPSGRAALAGLIDSTLGTAKRFAANAVVPPRIADLAEGALQTMYGTRMKIITAVLLIAGIGGAGAAYWGTPQNAVQPPPRESFTPKAADKAKADDPGTIAQNMAQSRLNLKRLALGMIQYATTYKGPMPPSATISKTGKPLLSWRVMILPYLGERELYEQFKLTEPWDSPHNKKLLSKMPSVFAPPDVRTRQPYSTFYQVFVSPEPVPGGKGAENGPGGDIQAAFVWGKPQIYPAHFPDGLAQTILIVEAGKAVPWTKPEDLPFPVAAGKPLEDGELGGLFRDVFHAVYANGHVHTLTKKCDEKALCAAITSNGGDIVHTWKIEAWSSNRAKTGESPEAVELREKIDDLRQDLLFYREQILQLKRDRLVQRERAKGKNAGRSDPNLEPLEQERARLELERKKLWEEIDALNEEIDDLLRKK